MRRRRYPYCRGPHTRAWCRVCNVPRFVRLMWDRDAWLCRTCGAKTTGFDVCMHEMPWIIRTETTTVEEFRRRYDRMGDSVVVRQIGPTLHLESWNGRDWYHAEIK